jgi:signal transduction histidine kinase
VVIGDVVADARFKDDAYVAKRRPRSVLCAPLSLKSKHHGLILLENDMSAGVFGDDRLQLVSILAGQLMNSLENALLADELRRANHRMARKNKRLEEMDSAKDAFLAVASHELRTPLTGISGMAGLMEDTAMSDYQGECLRDIEAESETLLELVNDVLDLSKLKAMKVTLVRDHDHCHIVVDSPRVATYCRWRRRLGWRSCSRRASPSCPPNQRFIVVLSLCRKIAWPRCLTPGCAYDIPDAKMAFAVDPEVPRYVTTDRGRLQQLICSLVGHTLLLSNNQADRSEPLYRASSGEVPTRGRKGEITLTVTLEKELQLPDAVAGSTPTHEERRVIPPGQALKKQHSARVHVPRSSSYDAQEDERERRGNQHSVLAEPAIACTKGVALHIRVQGTTMTIGDDEFAELFDPFTPVAGLARPAKFSSVGLGTDSSFLRSFSCYALSLLFAFAHSFVLSRIHAPPSFRAAPVRRAESVLRRQDLGRERPWRLVPSHHPSWHRYTLHRARTKFAHLELRH